MNDYQEVLNDLENQVERTEKEFEEVKDSGEASDKQERAQELMKEIKGQIEFLEKQMDKTQ
jgi:ABC-type Fe3+-hydroxamate transport system substrate-binding protein